MKDLKGAESIAEIITTDLKEIFNTDFIYVKVEATDLNTYKIIGELLNDHIEKIYKWNIEVPYYLNLNYIIHIIKEDIILYKYEL